MSVFPSRQLTVPFLGKLASDYAVGESVFLNVNGTSRGFLVINQGIPSGSSLYDSSCDGTWLLMKDLYESRVWDSSNNDYANSDIHAYLNGTFLGLFDSSVQSAIKQVKIPYKRGTGTSSYDVESGSNGLSTKVFLLGCCELNLSRSVVGSSYVPEDGACTAYFEGLGSQDPKRYAYYNGTKDSWWTRTANKQYSNNSYVVTNLGGYGGSPCTNTNYVRPALVIPYDTKFDSDTNEVIV